MYLTPPGTISCVHRAHPASKGSAGRAAVPDSAPTPRHVAGAGVLAGDRVQTPLKGPLGVCQRRGAVIVSFRHPLHLVVGGVKYIPL